MRFELTEVARRIMGDGWSQDLPAAENPISNGRLRFDALRVEAASDAIGGHRIVLSFYGRDVAVGRIGDYIPGMTLHLAGIEAAMDLEVRDF